MSKNIFIIAAKRSPIGSYGGVFANIAAVDLAANCIKSALIEKLINTADIEAIAMGNVLSANVGQAPARQASMAAGLPNTVCATTVNKVCASGMKAISIISNDIAVGNINLGLAGGMESMSNTPHYLPNARFGIGFGNNQLIDGLAKDGLTDVYNQTLMGVSADKTAEKYNISRAEQDNFAENSFRKSEAATRNGYFEKEIASIEVKQKKGEPIIISEDENIKKANFEKMRLLKPAFSPDGTVTAASASPMSDGASALLLASEAYTISNNLIPQARIVAYAEAEHDPMFFTTAPVFAAEKALKKANLNYSDIDYYEINEAFAVVPLAFIKMTGISAEKVNYFGGAVAIGHPLGSSGSRVVVTLLNVLKTTNTRYGLAAICNGGGGASALIIENLA